MKPNAHFRKFVKDHPGAISLATAVAIEAAIKDGRKVHFKLLDGLMEFIYRRGSYITSPEELIRTIALYEPNTLYRYNALDEFMEGISELIGAHGVERISDDNGDVTFTYANTGDTYTRTIAHDGEKILITSWGDWVEWAERNRRPRLKFR
jgi:hypothetical protein